MHQWLLPAVQCSLMPVGQRSVILVVPGALMTAEDRTLMPVGNGLFMPAGHELGPTVFYPNGLAQGGFHRLVAGDHPKSVFF